MSIQKNIYPDSVEFLMPERVDGTVANELEIAIIETRNGGAEKILVNLSGSIFLCSSGIRVILQNHRQMKAKGLTLLISRTSPEIDAVLELTGFRAQLLE